MNMTNCVDLILVSAIAVYIVDVSGFTESWRNGLQRVLNLKSLRSLKPFDCGTCMAWWSCIVYSLFTHTFSLPTIAFSALMALLALPMGQLMMMIREWLSVLIGKSFPK